MCCFLLNTLQESCAPGLTSILGSLDELALCYCFNLYLSVYFLCSICRKMIRLYSAIKGGGSTTFCTSLA